MPRTNLGKTTIKARRARMLTNGTDAIRAAALKADMKNTHLADICNVRRETISRWWATPEKITFGDLASMALALGLEIRVIDPKKDQIVHREASVYDY